MGFHIVKRDHCPLWKKLCLYLLAVGAALAVGGLLLMFQAFVQIAVILTKKNKEEKA